MLPEKSPNPPEKAPTLPEKLPVVSEKSPVPPEKSPTNINKNKDRNININETHLFDGLLVMIRARAFRMADCGCVLMIILREICFSTLLVGVSWVVE